MKKIYLIRHGRTAANEGGVYCGATDLSLSAAGAAALRVQRDSEIYPDISGCRVYTSGLRRTEETLFELYGDRPHTAEPELREMDFGAFELRSYEQLKDAPDYQKWISGDNEANVCPGGESGTQLRERALRAFERIAGGDGDALIVSHGGPIAAIMARLFPEEGKNRYEWQPKAGRGYEILLDGRAAAGYSEIPAACEDAGRFDWSRGRFAFFSHRDCECFPCHPGIEPEDFNCLFCYCPLYALGENCGGDFRYTSKGCKDCSRCDLPHRRESYPLIIGKFEQLKALASKKK